MTSGIDPAALEWSDLAVILAVCRAGSLSGAARALGHNHSTVFRRINAIEERTNVRFFERLRDGYKMTDAGRTAMAYGERVEVEMHALSREILGQDLRLHGEVRVTAPEGFIGGIGAKLFAKFIREHPGITIEGDGGFDAVDLSRREADLAIRATSKPPGTSVGRAICDFRFACYASREFRERNRDVPLAEQSWCTITGYLRWLVPSVWKKESQGKERVVYSTRSTYSMVNALAEGIGAALLPCYVGDAEERLVRMTPPFEHLSLKLWILTHQDLRHTARVKVLSAFMQEELAARSALFDGTGYSEA